MCPQRGSWLVGKKKLLKRIVWIHLIIKDTRRCHNNAGYCWNILSKSAVFCCVGDSPNLQAWDYLPQNLVLSFYREREIVGFLRRTSRCTYPGGPSSCSSWGEPVRLAGLWNPVTHNLASNQLNALLHRSHIRVSKPIWPGVEVHLKIK